MIILCLEFKSTLLSVFRIFRSCNDPLELVVGGNPFEEYAEELSPDSHLVQNSIALREMQYGKSCNVFFLCDMNWWLADIMLLCAVSEVLF